MEIYNVILGETYRTTVARSFEYFNPDLTTSHIVMPAGTEVVAAEIIDTPHSLYWMRGGNWRAVVCHSPLPSVDDIGCAIIGATFLEPAGDAQ